MRIAVFGAGAWGTALAVAIARKHPVTLWARNPVHVAALTQDRENRTYLKGVQFPANLALETDFARCARGADLHLVVPSLAGLRETVRALNTCAPDIPLLWASKGLEAGTGKLPHDIVEEELGSLAHCGVLTGPSFAAEVGRGLPTAITLAAQDIAFAEHWARVLHQPMLRIYASDDLPGAEIGGGLKNVIAIAAGIGDGLQFGLNARAALITRGLAEITRLARALGARSETLMGLAGMGDLVLTCTGDLSRNRRVGLALAQGHSLERILADLGHVAEGVPTTRAAVQLAARHNVELPICSAVLQVLDGHIDPRAAVEQLLARDPRQE